MASFISSSLKPRAAFTLVELAIVLVIVGLLVGAVISGKSLIHASQLRSVMTEEQHTILAVREFDDKYSALPGDMPNATDYWPTATCCGDNNGLIGMFPLGSPEQWAFWQQLALAGLIPGTYTGIGYGSERDTAYGGGPVGNVRGAIPGQNVLQSRFPKAGWTAVAADGGYIGFTGNIMYFGGWDGVLESLYPILKPEDAWDIDSKMDDGIPNTGNIYGFGCDTGASPDKYNLGSSAVACPLIFYHPF